MIDTTAFHKLSYGLYLLAAQDGEERCGCVVNTFLQVTSSPARVSVAVNKDNRTAQIIAKAGRYTAVVLDESAPMELIGTFGFHTSTEIDKFANVQFATDADGVPYVTEHVCARFSVRVMETVDVGSHLLFIGEVEQAESLGDGTPMTYAYYHQVKGGKTPPKASAFDPNEAAAGAPAAGAGGKTAWRCTICGYIEYADELPDDFTCPICGAGREMFERIEV